MSICSKQYCNYCLFIRISKVLTPEERLDLKTALTNNTVSSFNVNHLIPSVVRLSLDGVVLPLPNPAEKDRGDEWQSCQLSILNENAYAKFINHTMSTQDSEELSTREWWSVKCGGSEDSTKIYTISAKFVQIAALLSASNVLGLYIGIVYTVGRFLRYYFFNLRHDIVYNMPVSKHLRKICDVS